MKAFLKMLCFVTCLVVLGCGRAAQPGQEVKATPVRVGVYDSRAVAVAYAGSTFCRDYLRGLDARYDEAKASGDEKRIAEVEAEGREQQKRLHMQGFSTAPVDNILAHVSSEISEIKQRAGVDALVSKWDRETLTKYKSAELVDVTMMVVDAFHPDEKQRKSAAEIRKHEPISLDQAENIQD